MKRVGSFITAFVLLALFAVVTPGYAGTTQQQGKNEGKKQAQQQRQLEKKQQQQEKHAQQRARQVQRSQQQRHAQEAQQRSFWPQRRARQWNNERRTWRQRGGYNGYRIPDDYFRVHYGRSHWFRVYSLPFMVVGGYPRFQYGGYWFILLDPYPEYWGPAWYQTDDVYVDYYYDGYYLFNRRFPGRSGIAISITF